MFMNRMKFIQRTLWTSLGVGIASGLYAWQIEPFWLEFVHKKMLIRNLPDHLIGKKLMQISDMHVGNRFDYQYLIESLQKAQALRPDFVVYTGDFVSYETPKQISQLHEVLQHAALGSLGTVAILGNHDYGKAWSEQSVANAVTQTLTENGIQVLSNQQIELNGLHIIGMDDYWGLNFDPKKALLEYNPKNASLVLCHNPDVCDLDVWDNYKGWILAGHTHGGQCKPPFLPAPMLPVENSRYVSGEIDLFDGRTLYVNRALGHLWQVRFNVRPEITIFELAKG